MIKFLKIVAISIMMVLATPWQAANAATGATSISVTIPDIIILHYVSSLSITFTGAGLDTQDDEGAATGFSGAFAATVAAVGGLTTGTLDSDTAFDTTGGIATVTVSDAWAVRGVTSTGDIRVSGTISDASANNVASIVTLSNILLDSANDATSFADANSDFTAPGMAKPNAELGDVRFDVDISAVTLTGAHTTGEYTLTAAAL
ncbi:MAG: hypothetical protein OQL16_00130 [Gammaproteobacteria bacterium]|nr:hypothetical protein [Gammaproteobacteria bacterium]